MLTKLHFLAHKTTIVLHFIALNCAENLPSGSTVTASDEKMMQMALVENIQREDLNSIEIALAYNNLIEQFQLTQEQLAEKVGKKRTTIANYLRLLKLPA